MRFDDGANGDHTRGTSSWLTGVHRKRTEGADVRNGISADQIAAAEIGKTTALPSLELASTSTSWPAVREQLQLRVYMNTLSWRSPTAPLPTENNPRIVFERLFGDGGTSAERLGAGAREPQHPRFGDSTISIVSSIARRDRSRQGRDYVDSVREVERRIQRVESGGASRSCRRWNVRRVSPTGSTSTSS